MWMRATMDAWHSKTLKHAAHMRENGNANGAPLIPKSRAHWAQNITIKIPHELGLDFLVTTKRIKKFAMQIHFAAGMKITNDTDAKNTTCRIFVQYQSVANRAAINFPVPKRLASITTTPQENSAVGYATDVI